MPSEQEDRDATATQFVAALGAATAAANYPLTMVRGTMAATSRAYGLDNQFLALPNYVQVGSATGDGLYIVNPDVDLRYDQSFPLAQLVARAPTGEISPEEGMARAGSNSQAAETISAVDRGAGVTAGIFFVLGLILLSPELLAAWTRTGSRDGTLLGMTIPVPQALMHVTLFLAALTFMYVGARAVGDGDYRSEFLDPLIDDLKLTLLARNRYRYSKSVPQRNDSIDEAGDDQGAQDGSDSATSAR